MGFVTWQRFEVSSGQGSYLRDMSIFEPDQVNLVEQALRRGPEEGVTGKLTDLCPLATTTGR